jgi:hypothetical protein
MQCGMLERSMLDKSLKQIGLSPMFSHALHNSNKCTERMRRDYNKWTADDEDILEIVNDPGILAHTELGSKVYKIHYAYVS